MTTNRIITRGMGTSRSVVGRAGMVTSGFGGFTQALIEQATRIIRVGQSGTKRALRELEDVVVFARLQYVNHIAPKVEIKGFITVKVNAARDYAVSLVEHVSTRVRSALKDVRISIERIR